MFSRFSSALLSVSGLRLELPSAAAGSGVRGRAEALRNVSFALGEGEALALLGRSGAGKSLLARSLVGLLPPGARRIGGSVRFRGSELRRESDFAPLRGCEISLLAQDSDAAFFPHARSGVQLLRGSARVGGPERRRRFAHFASRLGLPRGKDLSWPHRLSGGERARFLLAGALSARPSVLLADEPGSSVDVATLADLLGLLRFCMAEEGLSVLLISHDLGVARSLCSRAVVLDAGRSVHEGALDGAAFSGAGLLRDLAEAQPGFGRSSLSRRRGLGEDPEGGVVRGAGLTGAELSHRAGGAVLVEEASFSLSAGESVALLGRSGSGKSSLARLVAGLARGSGGRLESAPLDSGPLLRHDPRRSASKAWHGRVQYVSQDPGRSLHPYRRVGGALSEAVGLFASGARSGARSRASDLLEEMGLPRGFAFRFPHELSGGERQRVALARALAVSPGVLLADEVVSSLDSISAHRVQLLLERLRASHGLTILFITHDLRRAFSFASRALVMESAHLVEESEMGRLLSAPMSAAAVRLVSAARALEPV